MLALFISSGGDLYFNHVVVQSVRPLDINCLKKAWQIVIDRNEMLRTGFCHVKGEPSPFAMVTYKPGTFDLPWFECASSSTKKFTDERPNGIGSPNDLHRPPWYLNVQFLQTHTVVRLSALHALYDAHSLNLILEEVSRLYNGERLPEPIPITPVLGSIMTESVERGDELERIWEDICKDMPVTKFPNLNPIRTDKRETHSLTKTCSKSLATIHMGCTGAEVTLQAAGQAAWARLLASYVGENEIAYGVVLSGRGISTKAQDVVFPCLTTVPSRYKIEGSNKQLVQGIMKLNALLIKGQHISLTKLQRMASSETALFDTLFVYQKFPSTAEGPQFWSIVEQEAMSDVRPMLLKVSLQLTKLIVSCFH